jgi:hypothetical protein
MASVALECDRGMKGLLSMKRRLVGIRKREEGLARPARSPSFILA